MRFRALGQLVVVAYTIATAGAACNDPAPRPDPVNPPTGDVFTAADGTRFAVQVFATGLEIPWGMAFAPDGRLFVTERPGRVRIIESGRLLAPALVLDDVAAVGEAGTLGLTLHPQFGSNRFVYIAYTARLPNGAMVNRVVRYREVGNTLGERAVILDGLNANTIHDGSRVRFGPDGKLYVTMGDAASPSIAQDLGSLNGKILRLNEDGTHPSDNPFPSPIWSYGHRNPQGIDWHPVTGDLWETEHGQIGNDEVNRIEAGRNYGWPIIEGDATRAGMETPLLSFSPAIAPSGASFYTGNLIPAFRNNLFFTALRGEHLHRVRLDPANPRRVAANERLVDGRYGRIRDVITGLDGALYFSTNNRDGRGNVSPDDDRVLRIVPASN
jgi:aldose sugar dehydrogenase